MGILLIDLDGTIIDSYPGIRESFVHAINHLGLPVPSEAQLRKVPGPPVYDSLRGFGCDHETASRGVDVFRGSYESEGWRQCSVFPGWEAALQRWKQQGFQLATATSKGEELAKRTLEAFDLAHYFDFIGGANAAQQRRGKAAVIKHVLDTMGWSPDQHPMVMIGDRIHDVEGATAFGIETVLVRWGQGDEEEWQQAAALADDMQHLEEIIDGHFAAGHATV